jgi:hypothetical protein
MIEPGLVRHDAAEVRMTRVSGRFSTAPSVSPRRSRAAGVSETAARPGGVSSACPTAVAPAAWPGTSFMPQMGQSPGLSDTTAGCIGQWYSGAAGSAFRPASIGTSFMPQMGQSPGLSETTLGCIGQ